ncbi:MAG: serine hydrolase [Bacteroidetes bacterium]|nr:serine hydrolase [Bacteroidota bacterium]
MNIFNAIATSAHLKRHIDGLIAFILSRKLTSAPGAVWNYSGANAMLLEEILRKATGQQLDKFAEKNLFELSALVPYCDFPISAESNFKCLSINFCSFSFKPEKDRLDQLPAFIDQFVVVFLPVWDKETLITLLSSASKYRIINQALPF